jgi:hypothetical protein
MKELWRKIPSFPDYEVSNHGRLRKDNKLMDPHFSKEGYHRYVLKLNGKKYHRTVHPLVLEAFVCPRPVFPRVHDACHNDGNADNNKLSNLRWDTRKSNIHDQRKHGTLVIGEKQNRAIMTEEKVLSLRAKYEQGIGWKQLAQEFGISRGTVYQILSRTSWKHI